VAVPFNRMLKNGASGRDPFVFHLPTSEFRLQIMPLAFESLSHGTIAFGFFNIESDMLLLDRYFFFAGDFCDCVTALACPAAGGEMLRHAYVFDRSGDIGDLMGAIHGVRYTGFIGEVYRRFPFPAEPAGFKQMADGWKTRDIMLGIISHYAVRRDIEMAVTPEACGIEIGDYRFSRAEFHELLKYVWRGGYPRWKNGVRPEYVLHMADAACKSAGALFAGISFSTKAPEPRETERAANGFSDPVVGGKR
jgi:hypothetical protein